MSETKSITFRNGAKITLRSDMPTKQYIDWTECDYEDHDDYKHMPESDKTEVLLYSKNLDQYDTGYWNLSDRGDWWNCSTLDTTDVTHWAELQPPK